QCILQKLDRLIGGRRTKRSVRCVEDQHEDAEGDKDGGVDAKNPRYSKAPGTNPIRGRPARQRLQQNETADDEKEIDRRGAVAEGGQKVRRPSAIDMIGPPMEESRGAARGIVPRRLPHMRSHDHERSQAAQSLEARKEFIFPACWYWR